MGGGDRGITVTGVTASGIKADEAVTSPAMISHKHPQGGPRPPDTPLQELTQELSSGTKQVMGSSHPRTWGQGYPVVVVPYLTTACFTFVVPCLTAPSFTLGIIGTVRLPVLVSDLFPRTVDALLFIFVVDTLPIRN